MASKSEQAIDQLSGINESTFEGDEAARVKAIAEAQKLLNRLQSPMDRCYDLMSSCWVWGTIQTLKDLGIWEAWANDGGEKTLQGLVDLANTDVDINLLRA
jgi:fumagillin biosynthesis methyltransferase